MGLWIIILLCQLSECWNHRCAVRQTSSPGFLGEKHVLGEVEGWAKIVFFCIAMLSPWGFPKTENQKYRKIKQKTKPLMLPFQGHEKKLISAVIGKWEVSQQSNFPWLHSALLCTWMECWIQPAISLGKHCLIETAHWNRGISLEQSPLRLGRWGWASCQYFETPWHSQRSCDFLGSIKTLERLESSELFTPKYKQLLCQGGWGLKLWPTRRAPGNWEGPERVVDTFAVEKEASGLSEKPPSQRDCLTSSSSGLSLIINCVYWSFVAWQPTQLISSLTLTQPAFFQAKQRASTSALQAQGCTAPLPSLSLQHRSPCPLCSVHKTIKQHCQSHPTYEPFFILF